MRGPGHAVFKPQSDWVEPWVNELGASWNYYRVSWEQSRASWEYKRRGWDSRPPSPFFNSHFFSSSGEDAAKKMIAKKRKRAPGNL